MLATLGAMQEDTKEGTMSRCCTLHVQASDSQGKAVGTHTGAEWKTPAEETSARLLLQDETLQWIAARAIEMRLVITSLEIHWDLPDSAFAYMPRPVLPRDHL
jgi:hypothetical protein